MRVIKDEKNKTTRSEALDGILYMSGIIALVSAFIFGQKIAGEFYWDLDWVNKGPERMKIYVRDFEARTYADTLGKSLNFRLLKPLAYDHNRKYPLILCLSYGTGNDNISQIDRSPEAQFLFQPANRKNYPAFIIVPQCPPGFTWGGYGKYPYVDSLVFKAIYALEKEFEIDQSRLYVMGESMGGFGTWHFISANPKMFAAAIPICGGGDTSFASNIVGVHVWAFHGRKDKNVPVKYTRTMIEYLKKAGGDPKYTEFPNEGHYISESVKNTSGLLDWLFAQKREN